MREGHRSTFFWKLPLGPRPEGSGPEASVSRRIRRLHTPAYWNAQYVKRRATFEWYMPWGAALDIVLSKHRSGARCLDVGCGTSNVVEDLRRRGYRAEGVDFAAAAISHWESRLGVNVARSRYTQGDVTDLPFADGRFQFVLDKGCLDALVFTRATHARAGLLALAIAEIGRVLAPGGTFYSMSTDPPDVRLDALRDAGARQPAWGLAWSVVEAGRGAEERAHSEGIEYFLYELSRGVSGGCT